MQLVELEKYKRDYPELSVPLSQLEAYFISLSEKTDNPVIVPMLLAKKLSINEELAIILLRLSDKAGLITPSYQIYCKELDSNIAEYRTIKEIPSTVFCPYHDTYHESDEYEIDLIFRFTSLIKKNLKIATPT